MYKDDICIMFVDDEPPVLSALRRLFRRVTCKFIFASGGKEALSLLRRFDVDIVISDMIMPEMNGSELLKIVAEKYLGTVRLMLSGYSDEKLIMSSFDDGAILGYMTKPWDNDEMLTMLEQIIIMTREDRKQ